MVRLLFRLHPLFYWIGGLAIAALGVAVYFDTISDNEKSAEALASGPPAEVALQEFDHARHANAVDEVVVLGALETDAMYTLTRERSGVETSRSWAAPLRPTDGDDGGTTINAAIYETDGDVTAEVWQGWIAAMGVNGPVLRLHGVLESVSGGRRDQVEEAFAEQGLTLAKDAIFIDPFLKPREEELARKDPTSAAGVIGGLGGVVFLYGFFRRWMRRRG